MTTAIDYALMAGVSYRSIRDPNNRFSIPLGWSEVVGSYRNLTSTSGFEATSFANGSAHIKGVSIEFIIGLFHFAVNLGKLIEADPFS